mmetsp:Transcript_33751/g.87712  ORF Transcript_33751/g.87712 Transcript_33751/m.87712 type:complete len:211 (-) Transcript_33751:496-1128(-)
MRREVRVAPKACRVSSRVTIPESVRLFSRTSTASRRDAKVGSTAATASISLSRTPMWCSSSSLWLRSRKSPMGVGTIPTSSQCLMNCRGACRSTSAASAGSPMRRTGASNGGQDSGGLVTRFRTAAGQGWGAVGWSLVPKPGVPPPRTVCLTAATPPLARSMVTASRRPVRFRIEWRRKTIPSGGSSFPSSEAIAARVTAGSGAEFNCST